MSKLNPEVAAQIPILYAELHNKSKVAKQLGISPSTVARHLKNTDKEFVVMPKKKTVVTPELIERINKLYYEYRNMTKVSDELGIAVSTVSKYLSEENIALKKKEMDDRDALFYYIHRLFGPVKGKAISKWNLTQISRFRQKGYTYQGQLLTLKYFFEVKKSPITKANGSIGIIDFVYDEAKAYYLAQAKRADAVNAAIKEQLARDRVEIKYNPNDYFGRNRKKKQIDLNSLVEE